MESSLVHMCLVLVVVCLITPVTLSSCKKAEAERLRKAAGKNDDDTESESEDEDMRPWEDKEPRDIGFSQDAVDFLLHSAGSIHLSLPSGGGGESGGEGGGGSIGGGGRSVGGSSGGGSSSVAQGKGGVDRRSSPVEWLSEASWRLAERLSDGTVAGFDKFSADLKEAAPRFVDWFTHATPESEKLPLEWRNLDNRPFKKLCAIRVLRPDRFMPALVKMMKALIPDGEDS